MTVDFDFGAVIDDMTEREDVVKKVGVIGTCRLSGTNREVLKELE